MLVFVLGSGIGCRLLVAKCWLLVAGCWLLVLLVVVVVVAVVVVVVGFPSCLLLSLW